MADFSTLKISELVESKEAVLQTGPFGTQLKASDYVEEGVPVINVRNVGFGDIRQDNLEFLDEKMVEKLAAHKLQNGDIVFGRKGAVERHAFINGIGSGWIQGSDCLRLRIKSNRLDNGFVSHYLRTSAHQSWMQAVCSFGATMASLNQDIVKLITIPAPPLKIQQKIAAILSAYDDLIENNKRRIALLENMAEEIYREWFVRFRFPGWQDAEFEKGIPKGWESTPSDQVLDVLSGGTPKTDKPQYWDGDIPFFTPKDAKSEYYVFDTEKWITEKGLESCNSRLYKKNTIFITARGTVGKIALACVPMAMNQSCYALQPKDGRYSFYYFLAMVNAISHIKGISKSGVFDNIIVDTFKIVSLLVPNGATLSKFEDIIQPVFQQIESLSKTNLNLEKTKSALLPRLISGKLSVEDLDIQFPPSMQDDLTEKDAA